MRILIVGAGQLGNALAQLSAIDADVLDRSRLDLTLTSPDAIASTVAACAPDVVINATAYHRVDDAESSPDLAFALNATTPGWLARAATAVGARLVHVSTDYVFAGTASRPYREDDLPAPLGVYGASKLAGEQLVHAYSPDALVVRTSGVFGSPAPQARSQSNFVQAILRQARRALEQDGIQLRVVADQVVGPTYAQDLADAILGLLQARATGIVHVTNSGSCTWYDFARAIVAAAGLEVPVTPISTAERTDAARRPAYSVLDQTRLASFGVVMPHWRDALDRYLVATGDRSAKQLMVAGAGL